MIGRPGNHTCRFLLGDPSAEVDAYDLPGGPIAPAAKYEQALRRSVYTGPVIDSDVVFSTRSSSCEA